MPQKVLDTVGIRVYNKGVDKGRVVTTPTTHEREVTPMEKTYSVQIFDGQSTYCYTTRNTDIYRAENKVLSYHKAFGRNVVKVTIKEIRK